MGWNRAKMIAFCFNLFPDGVLEINIKNGKIEKMQQSKGEMQQCGFSESLSPFSWCLCLLYASTSNTQKTDIKAWLAHSVMTKPLQILN